MKVIELTVTFLYLIFIISIEQADGLFSNPLNKIKEKAKAYFKSKEKGEKINFLGYNAAEYPGTNAEYRTVNKQKWNEYYQCLKTQLQSGDELIPEALLLLEGKSIKLSCKICISPSEQLSINAIQWLWKSKDDSYMKPIELSEHVLLSPNTKSLELYNLQESQSGQYECRIGSSQMTPYFLTVANIPDAELHEVHAEGIALVGPYPKPEERINDLMILKTLWEEWSQCSNCDIVGRRFRIGFCMITLGINTSQVTEIENQENIYKMLKMFKYGIPCLSHILPTYIKQIPAIHKRKTEIMTGYCKKDCPEEKLFKVYDQNGKVIESANNSAGIYSLLQGLPPKTPEIERRLEYGTKGKTIIFSCPGNLNEDVPVQWQIGDKKIIPELIEMESNGRIFITISDKIHINQAHVHDSNIYSCWQHGNLAGTVRLIIEDRHIFNFNHHIMLLGMVLVFGTISFVFLRAYKSRKNTKI